MEDVKIKNIVEKAVEKTNGIVYLKPCWIARDFLPHGKRLGLKEEEYNMGKGVLLPKGGLARKQPPIALSVPMMKDCLILT